MKVKHYKQGVTLKVMFPLCLLQKAGIESAPVSLIVLFLTMFYTSYRLCEASGLLFAFNAQLM